MADKPRKWRNWQTHHLEGVALTRHAGSSPAFRTKKANPIGSLFHYQENNKLYEQMKIFYYIFLLLLFSYHIIAQNDQTYKRWWFGFEASFYFTDPSFVLPIFTADKDQIHLEARYNYEDLKSASVWAGYNIYGGKKFEYNITPMAGGIFGRSNGIAPGLELTLGYAGFELYSELEYVFDLEAKENNFFYSWTDFSCTPVKWLSFGISLQRTKAYKTDQEIQKGILARFNFNKFGTTMHFFNPLTEDFFGVLSFSYDF